YILADAVYDGYIKDGDHFKIGYKRDGFFIEGITLPAGVQKHYDKKMEAFLAKHKSAQRVWWSLEDTFKKTEGIGSFKHKMVNPQMENNAPIEKIKETGKTIHKTSSVSVASGPFRVYNSKGSESEMKALVRSMHRDNLLDSNSYYVIDYKKDDVYVNARKLTSSYANKYSAMLQAMGDKPGSGIIIEYVPKGVKVPDFYAGSTKIELQASGAYLPGIAELMFVDGNPNFILAHALYDGVLREQQNYTFQFSGGKTYFNGKLLPAPHQAKYTRLMRDFMVAHNVSSGKYIMRGAGVTKKQLNTPESGTRKERINKGRNEKGEYYVDRVIKMMAADGLIDTTRKHTMTYNARGIFVNGKKLSDEKAVKYETILKQGYGRTPRWIASDGISYSNEP
ncbi:MAG: hypothetical protein K8F30_13585, partial [Taibaiella sp.]|nr:hypothetical protein [Taibaiella sp.]